MLITVNMKVLVIGGNGYIGNRLIDYLKGYEITVVDSNEYVNESTNMSLKHIDFIIARYQDLDESFFLDFKTIILLAGQGSVSNSKNLELVLENNVNNFSGLLNNLTSTQKLIYASSSSVYGKTKFEADELSLLADPYNYYDLSKQTIDKIAALSGKCYFGLRFGTVNGYSKNLRNDLMINSMISDSLNGEIFISNKDINRPILGIDDLCKAILVVIEKGTLENAGLYNMNSFNATVDTIGKYVSEKTGCKINYNANTSNVNFKSSSKAYDFKIHSKKFEDTFDFKFTNTLDSIIDELTNNWGKICNFQNRLENFDYKIIDKCRVCKTKTTELLDLGYQPLANSYHDDNVLLQEYPLTLHRCTYCFHAQINIVVNPDKLFKNYSYVSGTSKTLQEYFYDFAVHSLARLGMYNSDYSDFDQTEIKVLDIACNDGSCLDAFERIEKENACFKITRVGIDPAENIYNSISKNKNHDIYCEYFNYKSVSKLKEKYGSFDIIIAQNVFAHIDNPSEFLSLCKELIKDRKTDLGGGLILIQTSQKNMILNAEFDTIYHEHLSFFNTNSMNYICNRNLMHLNNVDSVNIHGDSYLFEIVKSRPLIQSNVADTIYDEMCEGLYSEETYKSYHNQVLIYKNKFHNKILEYIEQNKCVIGIGSTAKSNVLLNFCQITSNQIPFILDENKLKQKLLTPGSNIQVKCLNYLESINLSNTIIVVFAWNFFEEIKEKIILKLKEYKKNGIVTILNINPLQESIIYI